MFITRYEGMEALSISVVVMGYTRLVHDHLLAAPKVKEWIAKIPGPQMVRDRTPWVVAGYTVDGFALLLIYLIYK
jgi:hypothetical protein